MIFMLKKGIIFFVIAAFVFVPAGSVMAASDDPFTDDEPESLKMAVDIALVRPLGIAATLVGSVLCIVAFPFSALGGDTSTPFEKLVKDPFNFTFKRQLGKF